MHAGPVEGKMFLAIIDAHSKSMKGSGCNQIFPVTVQKLRATFARFGIPETVVTDNGPCFA